VDPHVFELEHKKGKGYMKRLLRYRRVSPKPFFKESLFFYFFLQQRLSLLEPSLPLELLLYQP
jgi:hypothetical protein